jgi:hypothetical protein
MIKAINPSACTSTVNTSKPFWSSEDVNAFELVDFFKACRGKFLYLFYGGGGCDFEFVVFF